MKLAKDQLASIYHAERTHLNQMLDRKELTRQEYDEAIAGLPNWVNETFNNEAELLKDKMLLVFNNFVIASADRVEDLYEEFHYAQDYFCADDLEFVFASEFLENSENLVSDYRH